MSETEIPQGDFTSLQEATPHLEKHKHTIAIVSVVIATLLAGIFFYFYTLQKIDEMNEIAYDLSQNDPQEIIVESVCTLKDDISYYEEAMKTQNLEFCNCIESISDRQVCMTDTEQNFYHEQAIAQVDEQLCEKLINPTRKEACLSVVKESYDHLLANNKEQLAYTYLINGNDEKAIDVLESMLKENGDDYESLTELSLAYANQVIYGGLSEDQKKSNIEKALAYAKKAQQLDPNNPEGYRVEGFALEAEGKLPEALGVYELALEKFPNDILLLTGKGHIESMAGYLLQAMKTFELAASLDTNAQHSAVWANLCRLQANDSSTFQKAVETCQKVVDMQHAPQNHKSESLQIIAQIYIFGGKYDEALDTLRIAEVLSPRNDNVYVSMALAYNKKLEGEKAEEVARQALSINNQKTSAYYELAQALYLQKKNEEALESALRGLEVLDTDVSLLLPSKPRVEMDLSILISKIYSEKGDETSAQKYREQAEEIAKILNISL